MIRKFFGAGALILATLFSSLQAVDTLVEAKAAYFYPTSHEFREIYSDGGIYGLEVSCQAWRGFYPWFSASIVHKSGHSITTSPLVSSDSTRITLVPLGLGLKYLYPINFVDLYAGVGILGTYVHIKDNSPFVIRSSSKWGVGGIAKIGAIFNYKSFFVDLFSDYSYTKVDFHNTNHGQVVRHRANISDWSIGAGIGYRFGYVKKVHTKKTSMVEVESDRPLDKVGGISACDGEPGAGNDS
jgi:hypothetical protein